ncbi:DUF2335 domain-containing protein [Aeromonas encheleia]|uniref:DUF2335 domain-containing protein n=1 Tax=Aeromonas encheleia TaxID=73010 RepID=UPI000662733F|nr:DUF2335 domain-containing protein [Aeromonas encheleia]
MQNTADDEHEVTDTSSPTQDGQQLVDRLEHELQENPDPELVERIVQSPAIKRVVMEMHQGPLPPARAMAEYEQVLPGSAERIMRMAELEQSQRHSMQKEQLAQHKELSKGFLNNDRLGKWMGFAIVLAVLGFAAWMADKGHPTIAGILVGVDLVGLAAVFVIGRLLSRDDPNGNE